MPPPPGANRVNAEVVNFVETFHVERCNDAYDSPTYSTNTHKKYDKTTPLTTSVIESTVADKEKRIIFRSDLRYLTGC